MTADTIPIDDTARNGRNQLVLCPGRAFALARWIDGEWHMANGTLDFEPTHYRPTNHTGMPSGKENSAPPHSCPNGNGAASGRAEGRVGMPSDIQAGGAQ